jgi:hypothetical protein
MVSQHGILLAVAIISDHFGPLVSKVCRCLLRHGALPLQEIVRRLELSPGQVKNSLLVLIQHNCVQAFNAPRGNGDKTVTHYLAIFDNIVHRQRFSKFLSIIRADIPESEALLEGLLQNGRLTFGQLVERTISKVPEGESHYSCCYSFALGSFFISVLFHFLLLNFSFSVATTDHYSFFFLSQQWVITCSRQYHTSKGGNTNELQQTCICTLCGALPET